MTKISAHVWRDQSNNIAVGLSHGVKKVVKDTEFRFSQIMNQKQFDPVYMLVGWQGETAEVTAGPTPVQEVEISGKFVYSGDNPDSVNYDEIIYGIEQIATMLDTGRIEVASGVISPGPIPVNEP